MCSALRGERWLPLDTQGGYSHHRLWEAHSGCWVGQGRQSARGSVKEMQTEGLAESCVPEQEQGSPGRRP